MEPLLKWRPFELQAQVYRVLGNPARVRIIHELGERELSVRELAGYLGLPQASLSQHLTLMRRQGIVRVKRRDSSIYYTLINPRLLVACALLRQVITERLVESRRVAEDRLDRAGMAVAEVDRPTINIGRPCSSPVGGMS